MKCDIEHSSFVPDELEGRLGFVEIPDDYHGLGSPVLERFVCRNPIIDIGRVIETSPGEKFSIWAERNRPDDATFALET